jgi:excisionase family DNA binding protein
MNAIKIRPKVYTVAEFAQVLAISPRLVRGLIHRGELPALRIGRTYRILRKTAGSCLKSVRMVECLHDFPHHRADR